MAQRPQTPTQNKYQILGQIPSTSSSSSPKAKERYAQKSYQQAISTPPSSATPYPSLLVSSPIPSPSPLVPSPTDYIVKLNTSLVCTIENAHDQMTVQEIVKQIFPKDIYFLTSNLAKSRLFYEFILVDTDSIEVTDTPSPIDPTRISYSKAKIK